VHRRAVTTRLLMGFVPGGPVPLALAAVACLLLCGCSPGADYPSLFPAIHDMPPPRADTTLDPVQVQQATEDLITQRNHLTAEAQGAGQKNSPNPSASAANAPAANNPAASRQAAASGGGDGDANGARTAGAETK